MSLSNALLAVAGITAGAAYFDAKFHVSKDLDQLSRARKGERNFAKAVKQKKASGFFLFEAAAQRHKDALCIWSRQGEYTWTQAYERICQYGHYFLNLGVTPQQYVAVYLYNCPEFLFMWMGLLSIGAAPALINYNLASDALVHCIRLSGATLLLYDTAPECVSRIEGIQDQMAELGVQTLAFSDTIISHDYPRHRPPGDCFEDSRKVLPFALMYTSGTTGLPKASPLTVARNYPSASLMPKTFGQRPGIDRTYYCIPLYHGTGGIAAMNDLMSGISIAVAQKFSRSRFWQDCIDSQSTIFVYVGELVRYLLSGPPSPMDRQHQIRLIWGNGLSSDLWKNFQKRFGVPEIGEFFASTEGVLTLVNHYRSGYGMGAVGHHGWLLRQKYHRSYLPVKIDPDTGNIWRSPKTGFAQRMPYEEGGEILVRLPSRSSWTGYWRADEATQKKIVENVLNVGDLYYRTGDALRRDANGHWYFLDRLGDTYRWKGENVSTTEVSQVLGSHPGILEANVYGVKVPSHDGRAGCAAVALKDATPDTFDWASLTTLLQSELPPYAVPIFIRVREEVGSMSTHNFKHRKVPLRQEGVDPDSLGTKVAKGKEDRIFWLPARGSQYIPFTREDWDRLGEGRVRI